jgi:serpin B
MLAVGVLLLAGCSDKPTPQPDKPLRDLSATEKQLVASGGIFGLKLFREIAAEERDKNVFISPLSVAMALGMTYNGASGTTREAMKQALELQGMSLEEINQSYRSLIDLLCQLDPKVTMQIANSIWHRRDFAVESTFVNLNQTYFDAVVRDLDFRDDAAVTTINAWVNDKTNGRIKTIIDNIPDAVVMYLINAVYFNGTWTTRFDRDDTRDDQFILADGATKPCRMMSLEEFKFPSLHSEAFDAADLPYGDGNFRMAILLPHAGISVDSIVSLLTEENWRNWIAGFSEVKQDLYLPKLKIEYEIKLNQALSALGMGVAFTDQADFTGINSAGNLYITEVKHKTYVAVDEEGTEAAAVTSVGVGVTSAPQSFRVDRPFIFVIHEKRSGTILFMGKIVDPVWSEN